MPTTEKDGDKLANNDGKIVLGLDIPKTASQINADIQKLEKQLKQVKATGALDTSSTVKKINAQISSLQSQLKAFDINVNLNTSSVGKTTQQAEKLEKEFKAVKASVEQAKNAYDEYMQPVPNEKAASLINRINSLLTKNTKITNEAKVTLQGYADELGRGVNLSRWK